MRTTLRTALATLTLLSGWLAAPAAQAAFQTVAGTQFDLVYDDSFMGAFGTPTLVGNNIVFTPIDFRAESLNGQEIVTKDVTINLRLYARNGLSIGDLSLTERGVYRLRGALSEVSVDGQISAFGFANPSIQVTNKLQVAAPLTNRDGALHDWTASAGVSLLNGPASINQSAGVNVTIGNLLEAYTDSRDTGLLNALIEKKFSGAAVSLTVSMVPEPASALMGVVALLAWGQASLRRKIR
jgi:hypothetical protein